MSATVIPCLGDGDLQQPECHHKLTLSDPASLVLAIWLGKATTITPVPGGWGRMFWIGIIGSNLPVDAHGVKGNHADVDEGGQDRIPDLHDEGGKLAEEEEQ